MWRACLPQHFSKGADVEAARKYKRMVQVGSQSRSIPYKMQAIKLIREGAIGTLYQVKGSATAAVFRSAYTRRTRARRSRLG